MRRRRFPEHPPHLRTLAVAVALLAVALSLALTSVLFLWVTVAANRRDLGDLHAKDATLSGQVSALEAQVRSLGEVPVTQSTVPPPRTTSTTATTTRADTPDTRAPVSPTTTPPPGTTTSTTTTSTTTGPLLCVGPVGVGCVGPSRLGHPAPTVPTAVRSAAITTIGRHP